MNASQTGEISRRRPFVAVLFSLVAPGLGHIYCGRLNKGMILFFLGFALTPLVVAATVHIRKPSLLLVLAIASILFRSGLCLYTMIDSAILARREGTEYAVREFNRWSVYILFISLAMFGSINMDAGIKSHVLQAYKIVSSSMAPNILPHDYLLINKARYKLHPVQRGDVVIFTHPNNRSRDYIKRVVAMPGEIVEVRDHVLIVNGNPAVYKPAGSGDTTNIRDRFDGQVFEEVNGDAAYEVIIDEKYPTLSDFPRITVPNGHVFVLGDNRSAAEDSRSYGPIPLADVKGRVEFIYLPAETWSRFGVYRDRRE